MLDYRQLAPHLINAYFGLGPNPTAVQYIYSHCAASLPDHLLSYPRIVYSRLYRHFQYEYMYIVYLCPFGIVLQALYVRLYYGRRYTVLQVLIPFWMFRHWMKGICHRQQTAHYLSIIRKLSGCRRRIRTLKSIYKLRGSIVNICTESYVALSRTECT